MQPASVVQGVHTLQLGRPPLFSGYIIIVDAQQQQEQQAQMT
jgi:hypothetical protein